MRGLAMLSMHTSPLAQPGSGDSGGMNVYVRELASSLAQAGVPVDVFTRRADADAPDVVEVEPGLRVRHVDAGPADLPKEALVEVVDEFADGVAAAIAGTDVGAIHANYWLSGVAGHRLKHELDLPLVSTFHTLARVKAENGDAESRHREEAEAQVIGCSDAITASCLAEADDLVAHYGADRSRIEVVPPGVLHAFFSPGDRTAARMAVGIDAGRPVLLFVGRIQPLKGLDVAVEALAWLRRRHPDALLVVVGGASGAEGPGEVARIHELIGHLHLDGAVQFVEPQPHHMLSTWYRAADVVVVPSRSESFGLVALEAAACGTPVVAANVGGLRTLVEPGRTGFLVDGRDPADFAAAAGRILGDPALAASLAAGASSMAAGYRWSTTAARLRRLYADLTARQLVPLLLTVIVGDTPPALGDDELDEVAARIDAWARRQLGELDVVEAVETDTSDGRRWFLRVRGEVKDVFTIWLELRQRTLRYETYLLPSPPASREAVFEQALRLNHDLYGVAFTIGEEDALFLRGHVPSGAVDDAELDRILGTLYTLTERHFGWLVELAFRR